MEQYGSMEIINHSTGHRAQITFKPAGLHSKDLHHVEGFIIDKRYCLISLIYSSKYFIHLIFFSKTKLHYLYGKWTEFIKCVDINAYEDYLRENSHKFKKEGDGRSKSPNDSPSHTSRKMLAKFNSLKVGPFKSNSTQEVSYLNDANEQQQNPRQSRFIELGFVPNRQTY